MALRVPDRNVGSAKEEEQSNSTFGDNYLLRKEANCMLVFPTWDRTVTTVRILPAPDPDNPGQFLPGRLGTDRLSYFYFRGLGVKNFGGFPGITCLLHTDDNDPTYKHKSMNPFGILFESLSKAVADGNDQGGWASLIPQKGRRTTVLIKPADRFYLVQAFVVEKKSELQFGPAANGKPARVALGAKADGPTAVLYLAKTAGQSLFGAINERKLDWTGDPDDPGAFVSLDPVALHPGGYVRIYQASGDPRNQQQQQNDSQPISAFDDDGSGDGGGQASRDDPDSRRYGCHIVPSFKTLRGELPASLLTADGRVRPQVLSKAKPWPDVISVLTEVEQAHAICRQFLNYEDSKNPNSEKVRERLLSTLPYCFRGRPEWLLSEVLQAVRGPVSSSAPPAGYGYQPNPIQVSASAPVVQPRVQQAPASPPVLDPFGGDEDSGGSNGQSFFTPPSPLPPPRVPEPPAAKVDPVLSPVKLTTDQVAGALPNLPSETAIAAAMRVADERSRSRNPAPLVRK